MTGLARLQAAMAEALLSAAGDACPDLLDDRARRRFRVYRNNVQHGLSEALAEAYPAVHRLVGDAFFQGLARAFLVAHPPRARSLALFGDGFADFVATFPPASGLPYLADVARLERAVLEALHAADAEALDPTRLGGADCWTLDAHPATRLVPSPFPIVSIRRARGRTSIPHIAEHALVTRPADQVIVQALPPAAGRFAAAILTGEPVDRASERARALDPTFDEVTGWQPLLAGGALLGHCSDKSEMEIRR